MEDNRWFTSDLHLGHGNIIPFCDRPYHNVEEMDAEIIAHIRGTVKDDDQVYHLGDFTMETNYETTAKYFDQTTGRWHFVIGNHDNEGHLNRLQKDFPKRVLSVCTRKEAKIHGQKIVMDHYPLVTWEGIYHGSWHLYGHLHGNFEHPSMAAMDVGIDTNKMKIYHFKDIALRLTQRFVIDNHMVR